MLEQGSHNSHFASTFLIKVPMIFSKLAAVLVFFLPLVASQEVSIGSFTERDHDVRGDVFVLSERVIEIRNFMYDGQGPAVYWWIDTSSTPSTAGKGLLSPDNVPSCEKRLGFAADGSNTVRVELPEGESINGKFS